MSSSQIKELKAIWASNWLRPLGILNRAPVAPAAPCTAAVGCTAATEQNAEDVRAKGLVVFLGNLPYDIKPGDIMEKVSGCLQVRVITETVVCEESDGTNFRYYDFLKTYAFATLDDLKNVDRLLNMPIKFGERFARTYLAMPFTSKRRKVG